MNNLDLLFDSKQFAAVFRAAIGESSSVLLKGRPGATTRSEGEAATAGAGYSEDDGQKGRGLGKEMPLFPRDRNGDLPA